MYYCGEFLNAKSIKYNKIFLVVAGLAAVAHGIFVPFFKEISETTNDPIIDTFYLTGFASILSAIGVLIQHFATKHKIKIAGKWDQIIKLVMFYVIVEGIANYTYYYGLSKLPAINAAVLYNSMVVFGLLIGFFYFKERPTKINIWSTYNYRIYHRVTTEWKYRSCCKIPIKFKIGSSIIMI